MTSTTRRFSGRKLTIMLIAGCLAVVPGCGSGSGNSPKAPAPTSSSIAASVTPHGKPLHYVAFGDSWPAGAHCGGCRAFPYLWADLIEERTGRPVEITSFMGAAEHSAVESKTSTSLLASLRTDEETRDAVRGADVILVATGPNSLEDVLPTVWAGHCGGPDDAACIRNLGKMWAKDFTGILDEIRQVRHDRPAVIRLVNAANGFAIDPALSQASPPGFATGNGALIFELLTQAQCSAARAYDAVCVDIRSKIQEPGGDSNENSDASMQAVAQALMDTGLSK